jgi:hypothetical protein
MTATTLSALFTKLNLGVHRRIHVLNPPASFEGELRALKGVQILRSVVAKDGVVFALAFAITQTEVDALSRTLAAAVQGDAVMWIAYPKGTSKRYKCDFNRDSGWKVLGAAGFEPVRMVAIDEDWTALRFRNIRYIKSMVREPSRAVSAAGRKKAAKK